MPMIAQRMAAACAAKWMDAIETVFAELFAAIAARLAPP